MRPALAGLVVRLAAGLLLLVAAPTRAQEAPQSTVAPSVSPERLRAALARYRREPSAGAVVRAAIRARSASPGRVRDAMDRARATGWLPTARGSLRRGQTVDLRGLANGEASSIATDDALSFDASLVFRFDRVVFASEETTLLRELRVVEETNAELARVIVHLYFERRRLQLERDLLAPGDLARAVRILELEALLDVFTAGAFTRMMGHR